MRPLLAVLVLLPALALAQAEPLRVSLDSRGDDVREVLATLFAQAHRPYALDASIKGRLYVTLDRMPYAKALGIVLAQAGLVAKDRDGVTMVAPAPKPSFKLQAKPGGISLASPERATQPSPGRSPGSTRSSIRSPEGATDTRRLRPQDESRPVSKKPVPEIPLAVFAHRITTRLNRAPLADVFAALGEQAKVEIVLDPAVPAYRVDAFFAKTSLRYALDRVCKAAGLTYGVEEGKIVVRRLVVSLDSPPRRLGGSNSDSMGSQRAMGRGWGWRREPAADSQHKA